MTDRPADPGRADDTMRVISTVAHELRSPLTSLKGFSKLLLDRWDRLADDDRRDLVAHIHADAERLGRLVGELLDISRIEAGRVQVRPSLVEVAPVVAGVVARLAVVHPSLAVRTAVDADLAVWVDRDKVTQILTNLVENAAKYATADDIVVVADRAGDGLELTVADAGPGIPDDELELVFSRFYRRDVAQPSGTGLGLWISRGLAGALGGSLVARRNDRGGTTFCLSLPGAAPAAGALGDAGPAAG